MNLDIDSIFDYHPADTAEKMNTHQLVRDLVKHCAHSLNVIVPDSPEKTLAIRRLQEAMFYANSAVAQYSKDK